MEYPKNLKYTKEHEWAKLDGDAVTVGITDYAQDALGDIVYIELPKVGAALEKGKGAAVVESVKSVSDVFSPVSGKVTEVNEKLHNAPEVVNKNPYADGWMFKIKPGNRKDLDDLLDSGAYEKFVGTQKH